MRRDSVAACHDAATAARTMRREGAPLDGAGPPPMTGPLRRRRSLRFRCRIGGRLPPRQLGDCSVAVPCAPSRYAATVFYASEHAP